MCNIIFIYLEFLSLFIYKGLKFLCLVIVLYFSIRFKNEKRELIKEHNQG